jgi:hypothetical protein
VDKKRRRKPYRVRDVHGQFKPKETDQRHFLDESTGRAAHPTLITGIARNRVKRLQYAKQNSAQA